MKDEDEGLQHYRFAGVDLCCCSGTLSSQPLSLSSLFNAQKEDLPRKMLQFHRKVDIDPMSPEISIVSFMLGHDAGKN